MKYLIFTEKTKTDDCKYIGVFEANSFKEAKTLVNKHSKDCGIKHTFSPATTSEINFLKNDLHLRLNGKNTLNRRFDLSKEPILKII